MHYHSIKTLLFLLIASTYLFGCKKDAPIPEPSNTTQPTVVTPVYTYEIIATYPHDPNAFTQGLQFVDGILYEGTGLEGRSVVRKVELKNGKVLEEVKSDPMYFGEGIVVLGQSIYQITYVTEKGFVYDKKSLAKVDSFTYKGEGWGLTTDGASLIMSNGSSRINFLDPLTRSTTRSIEVLDGSDPVWNINELEYIKGEIWANIWMTDRIVRIDPATGKVLGWIDVSGILPPAERPRDGVLNGIAYDAATDRIFVTGKLWPKLFEIKIKPRSV
jgi:glutaminyl-peptide cyclotransferase